jgi:hypothetical protein
MLYRAIEQPRSLYGHACLELAAETAQEPRRARRGNAIEIEKKTALMRTLDC